jgi:hypothetical protein
MMRFGGQRSDAMHYSAGVALLSAGGEERSHNNGSGKREEREKRETEKKRCHSMSENKFVLSAIHPQSLSSPHSPIV